MSDVFLHVILAAPTHQPSKFNDCQFVMPDALMVPLMRNLGVVMKVKLIPDVARIFLTEVVHY